MRRFLARLWGSQPETPLPPVTTPTESEQPQPLPYRAATVAEVLDTRDSFVIEAVKQGCIYYKEIDQFHLESFDNASGKWKEAPPPHGVYAYTQIISRLREKSDIPIAQREKTVSIQSGSSKSEYGPFRLKNSRS